MSYAKYYQGLSNAYDIVVNKSSCESTVDNVVNQLQEIYGGKYGYRQTAVGRWRERDEPDEAEQYRQVDAIRKSVHKKRAQQSRERLKSSNKVPTRVATGKKLFDEFMIEVYEKTGKQKSARKEEDLKHVYLAARALDFDKFLIFLTDVLK